MKTRPADTLLAVMERLKRNPDGVSFSELRREFRTRRDLGGALASLRRGGIIERFRDSRPNRPGVKPIMFRLKGGR